jgi:DNA mismatch repair protein MutS2
MKLSVGRSIDQEELNMNEQALLRLEYGKMKEQLAQHTVSYLGLRLAEELKPSDNLRQVRAWLEETEEARQLVDKASSIPLPSLEGIDWIMGHFGKGYVLTENDFTSLETFLRSLEQLKKFMQRWESVAPLVCLYSRSIHNYSDLQEQIGRSIRYGRIIDSASSELGKVRKQILVVEDRLKKRLEAVMQKHRSILQESIVSLRGGRYVIPVKKEHRRLVPGSVLDESSSGQTIYVEPAELAVLQAELGELKFHESIEEQKVLAQLTELAEAHAPELTSDLEIVGHYDFLFAKAKYALSIRGKITAVNDGGMIRLKQARHPLLGSSMIPIDFAMGDGYRALVITGPNTGGKTVVLKTVGLLTLMVQSGLLPPVGEGTELAVFRRIEADIGDGQSLEQSLSTFSAHIRNLIELLKMADRSTLVLLDELASGTDPGEGIGLSIAVLEELYRLGATIVATTHYNEIKNYAEAAAGFENARMEFDTETLRPLYRLTIGQAGSSYAFFIALKLGMDERIIERSRQITAAAASSTPSENRMAGIAEEAAAAVRAVGHPNKGKQAGRKGEPPEPARKRDFAVGDCVYIHPLKRTGIVYRSADERGMVIVQVQKQKLKFNAKRLSLYIERKKLYPGEEYDMDIVFESVEARKKRHLMERKHVEGVALEYRED